MIRCQATRDVLTPEQNLRLEQLFGLASELPAAALAAFCARACRGEPELLSELMSLLAVLEAEGEAGTSPGEPADASG